MVTSDIGQSPNRASITTQPGLSIEKKKGIQNRALFRGPVWGLAGITARFRSYTRKDVRS